MTDSQIRHDTHQWRKSVVAGCLHEVNAFAPGTLAKMEAGPFELDGRIYKLRDIQYIPASQTLWRRLQTFWERTPEPEDVAAHWRNRTRNFLYLYSRSQSCLLAAGYFNAPYVSREADIRSSPLRYGPLRKQQNDLFEAFCTRMGPLIRSWYPLLPSMVDFHDLAKNLDIARSIAALFSEDLQPLRVLEIGAGGCLLPLMLRQLVPIQSYDVIDLPILIPLGTAMLGFLARDVGIELPGEDNPDAWLRYQTSGFHRLAKQSQDIVINITSFQEMSEHQVEAYFRLAAQSLKSGGLFVCVNRSEKATQFEAYPWHLIPGEVLVDEEDLTSRYYFDDQVIRRRIVRYKGG